MRKETMYRILLVDDDIDLLMLLERRLQKEGFVVETAASLPEAEEIAAYFLPHLVLLDININGEDGRLFCWKLKHTPELPNVKVFIISGYDLNTNRARLFGADEMVSKPLQTEYLLHLVKQHSPGAHGEGETLPPWLESGEL